ncbi:acidic mammalian chitinase-like [Haematobia irritans]|uniref:acidic mammalian chitinase-like n=1 Tax=Haematobia irritans TaxID=7368 RepID=UPI003F5099A6
MLKFAYILATILCPTITAVANSKIINCYFGTWAKYRPGNGKFEPENIDASLCTHLSYSFFGINDYNGEFRMLDSWLDLNEGLIKRTIALKTSNPNLKVLAVIGGWLEGSVKYSQMAADPIKRSNFIQSSLAFIKQHGFDGLDLDWEYPSKRGGLAVDKENFVTLLKELKEALASRNLLLGIAVGASAETAAMSYDIPNISKYVDFINVMTYDLQPQGILGFNAPLRGQSPNNVEDCINYWLMNGAPASKLVMGLAFYGRSFQLWDTMQTTPGSAISGLGAAGPYTQENGFLGFNEICSNEGSWTTVFDTTHRVPYMYKDNQWVGYDDVQSLNMKLDFLITKNLGGAMIWSIETDDFRGHCGGGQFPLLNAINKKLIRSGQTSSTQPSTTTLKPYSTSTTTKSPSSLDCERDGFFVHPIDCTRYYRCVTGIRYDFICPAGLHFDEHSSNCVWPDESNCGN